MVTGEQEKGSPTLNDGKRKLNKPNEKVNTSKPLFFLLAGNDDYVASLGDFAKPLNFLLTCFGCQT